MYYVTTVTRLYCVVHLVVCVLQLQRRSVQLLLKSFKLQHRLRCSRQLVGRAGQKECNARQTDNGQHSVNERSNEKTSLAQGRGSGGPCAWCFAGRSRGPHWRFADTTLNAQTSIRATHTAQSPDAGTAAQILHMDMYITHISHIICRPRRQQQRALWQQTLWPVVCRDGRLALRGAIFRCLEIGRCSKCCAILCGKTQYCQIAAAAAAAQAPA